MITLQAIVFDYDGVLADTEPLHLRAFQDCLRPHGVELSRADYFERYLGLDDDGVFTAIAENGRLGWDERFRAGLVADKTSRFREILMRQVVLYPTVADRLREWSRVVALAVASGSIREEIEPVLAAAGLAAHVSAIVAAGETPRGKPFPDPYDRAIALLSERRGSVAPIDPSACVAVEDSPWGIESARGAGLRVVGVATSYDASRLESADVVIPAFRDLDLQLMNDVVCLPPAARR